MVFCGGAAVFQKLPGRGLDVFGRELPVRGLLLGVVVIGTSSEKPRKILTLRSTTELRNPFVH
jgi:hypothetical protein